jgi:hypothetical protein
MEVVGTIISIGDTEVVGNSGFEKRLVVVQNEDQYVQKIPIEFVQGKVNLPDDFNEGERVKISINLRGSEYNGKHYLSANGWKIERL